MSRSEGHVEEIRTEMNKREQRELLKNILDSIPDIRSALQRDAAAAYTHPEVQPQPPGGSDHSPPESVCTSTPTQVHGAFGLQPHGHGLIPSTQPSHWSDGAEVDHRTLH